MQINLTNRQSTIDLSTFSRNKEWDILDVPMRRSVLHYACCNEDYIDVTATIKMKRRPGNLYHLYMGPAVCLALMVPTVFILPDESSHKMVLGEFFLRY